MPAAVCARKQAAETANQPSKPMLDFTAVLPGFLGLFLGITLAGHLALRHRTHRFHRTGVGNPLVVRQVGRLKALLYLLLLTGAGLTGLYAFAPGCYAALAFPIHSLDEPLINETGLLIMQLALSWLVGAQLISETLLNRQIAKSEGACLARLRGLFHDWFLNSAKLAAAPVVILLIGLFVTLSSVAALLLAGAGLLLFRLLLQYTDCSRDP